MLKEIINKIFSNETYAPRKFYVLKRFNVGELTILPSENYKETDDAYLNITPNNNDFDKFPILEIIYQSETEDETINQYKVLEKLGSKDIIVRFFPANTHTIHLKTNDDLTIKNSNIFGELVINIKAKRPIDFLVLKNNIINQ